MAASDEDALLPVLRAALEQTRSAACITTAELDEPGPKIVYVNPAYCEMLGRTREEVIGKTPRIMQGPLTSRAVLDRLRSDLADGRPFVGETVNYRKDGTAYYINWRIDPVTAPDGRVTHYIATQEDITKLRRAERILAAEKIIDSALSAVLNEPKNTQENLRSLGSEIMAAMVELVGYGQVGLSGSIMLGTAIEPFSWGPQVPDGAAATGPDPYDRSRLRSGTDGTEFWVAGSLDNKRTGIDGAVFVSGLDTPQFEFVDVDGFERITGAALRALNSLAEYERQRLLAIELQRTLLPTTPTGVEGLEVSAHYQPGAFGTRIGGDWHDIVLTDRSAVLFVGDVAGSGVRAAADMGRLRLLAQVLLQQEMPVPEVMAKLNQFCSDEDLMATALAVSLELDRGIYSGGAMTVTSAGHPPPLRRTRSEAGLLSIAPGPVLGIGGNPAYPEQKFDLGQDDLIVMFTDGLFERPTETVDVSLKRLTDKVGELSFEDHGPGRREEIGFLCSWLVTDRLLEDATDDVAILGFQCRL